jgi:hypothetical protein
VIIGSFRTGLKIQSDEVSQKIREENGIVTAADAIENYFSEKDAGGRK